MTISIIGTGRMGRALAGMLSQAGKEVIWGSRSFEQVGRLQQELSLKVKPVPLSEALQAPIVIPALWHQDLIHWLPAHAKALRSSMVVDITNPFNASFDGFTTDYNTSSAEELQKLVPGLPIVGAFKNTFWHVFQQPVHEGVYSDVYVTSDDSVARTKVMSALVGTPFRILDGGQLINNRVIERMTLFSRELSKRYEHYPYVSWRLWGGNSE